MITAHTSLKTKLAIAATSLCIVGAGTLFMSTTAYGQEAPAPTTGEQVQPLATPTSAPAPTQQFATGDVEPQGVVLEVSSLSAIPPRLGDDGTMQVSPGETLSRNVQVRNNSDKAITIRTDIQDFIVEDGETPIPIDPNEAVSNKWSLADWVVLTPQVQTIQPQEIGQVNVIITVPADALPGGHYAMVTHQPSSGSVANQGSSINQKVGTLLYLVVEGAINESAVINDFSFQEFSEYGPVPYQFTAINQSDVHINPHIKLEVKNMMGQVVETIVPESKNIFPGNLRQFSGTWDRVWGFGLYTAEITMSYGSTGQVATAATSFWIIPVKLILAIAVLILVAIASFISLRRHMLHRNSDDKKRIEMLEEELQKAQKKS